MTPRVTGTERPGISGHLAVSQAALAWKSQPLYIRELSELSMHIVPDRLRGYVGCGPRRETSETSKMESWSGVSDHEDHPALPRPLRHPRVESSGVRAWRLSPGGPSGPTRVGKSWAYLANWRRSAALQAWVQHCHGILSGRSPEVLSLVANPYASSGRRSQSTWVRNDY